MGIVSLPSFGTDPATVNAANLDGKVDPLATEFNGNIENANIKAGAAIAYAKLNLTGGILNADVNASADIADSKLATITTAGKVNSSALVTTDQAAGDVIYNDGTNWVRLAKDEGKYLKSGASAVSWDTPNVAAVDGMVVQVVNTQSGALITAANTELIPVDDTIPQITEGKELFTRTITPKATTNKLLIQIVVNWATNTGARGTIALFQGTTANALACSSQYTPDGTLQEQVVFNHYMDAGTTDEITFRVRGGMSNTALMYVNGNSGGRSFGGVYISGITITEIKAS
jgi:hypothetical protein